jgi:hypothetical protein
MKCCKCLQTKMANLLIGSSNVNRHYRAADFPAANTRPLKSFTFIDSISRFGRQLTKEDLETAYGRAGRSFNGQLQQNFVVLNERDQDLLQSVSQPKPGGSGGAHQNLGKASARGRGGETKVRLGVPKDLERKLKPQTPKNDLYVRFNIHGH